MQNIRCTYNYHIGEEQCSKRMIEWNNMNTKTNKRGRILLL